MQLIGKMLRGLFVALAGLALLVTAPKPSFAFTNGYNLIRIQSCVTSSQGDFDVLVVYDSITGGALITVDALAILSVLPVCAAGGAFYAILNNGSVTNVVVIPGLR